MDRPDKSKAKLPASRHRGHIQVQLVQSKDPFPNDFLGFLHVLPPSDATRNDTGATDEPEPPKKRARIEKIKPIPIAREAITIKRPTQSEVPITEPVSRVNVNRYMRLNYDRLSHILSVSSNSKSPYGAFKVEFPLGPPKPTKSALVILDVMNRSRDADDEEGALWVNAAIDLERENKKDQVRFSFALNWNPSTYSLRNPSQRALSQEVLDTFFENQKQGLDGVDKELPPQAFYDAAFAPEKDHTNFLSISAPRLTSKLFPFQRRTLQWLLRREGVQWSDRCSDGAPGLELLSPLPPAVLPLSFSAGEDADGRTIYISDLYHIVTRDPVPFHKSEIAIRGGILAEEMGLGKTVETISLICMHTRESLPGLDDDSIAPGLRPTGATLIVTPATLENQWVSELSKHAPHLNVMVYEGLKGFTGEESQLISEIAGHHVVVTTYNVLQAEIYFAEEPPSRSMRHERKYRRPKSPLIQVSWWRVCLDEAQQVESGVSNAAKLARLIPRINAWGITGTPVKENAKDLWGLLSFLRYEPFASSLTIWEGLMTSHQQLFKPLFNRISLRHTKRAVRDELTLPPQKRYIITVSFGAIEEQHYRERFEELAIICGLDKYGTPFREDWDPDNPRTIDWMKHALAELRQTILHPSLMPGKMLRSAEVKNKPLRTVDEVLDAMIEQSESSMWNDRRHCLHLKLDRGQILEMQSEVREAIALWQQVSDEVQVAIKECRNQLESEVEKAKRASPNDKCDGAEDKGSHDDENPEGVHAPTRVSECRRKLRLMLYIHHKAIFFIASGYYQLKNDKEKTDPNSEEFKALEEKEISGYETAKNIRKEILHEARTKAYSHISKIREKMTTQSFVEIPEIQFSPFQGLEIRRILDNFLLLGEALNRQADLIDEWREEIIQMLVRPLVDEEEDAITGDEYEESTMIQDELMAYTLAVRAAIADRQDAMSGLENERIKYDTRFAQRQAKSGQGHAPEKVLALLERRQDLKPSGRGTSFRGIITDLRELATKLRYDVGNGGSRERIELELVEKQLRSTQEQSAAQNKAAATLEKELDRFVSALNARVEFYRQLQSISDTVGPVHIAEGYSLYGAAQAAMSNERSLQKGIDAALPKHRYLLHLKEVGQDSEEVCIICQFSFTVGVLTVCGHQFCKECLMCWFEKRHSCPVCNKQLTKAMLHDITLKKQELRVRQEHPHTSGNVGSPTKSKKLGIYSQFSEEKLEAIKSIDLRRPSFYTKIDTLAKHLLWLRAEDPGAKSVVFSQFSMFLDILGHAFEQQGIGFSSFRMKNGIKRFKEDPGIECFLMDARAHASGLNLVNASHVLLCEPLLNTALELQAIARVDRIGQEHETTVWLYLTDGTVEESIYDLSIQRRLEHLDKNTKGKSRESTPDVSDLKLEAANSLELEQASLSKLMSKDQSLGEAVDKNDLWQCLFGHVAKGKALDDDRLNNPAVMGFLAGEAAEARRQARAEEGSSE
ncbi:hypothetical protein AAE478_004645 [Parahypoxylon ruwenzoriense]